MKYDTFFISDNKPFPNNRLPVIIYTEIFHREKEDYGEDFLRLFRENDWGNSWRNGVYPYHHYHAEAHEVLGCAKGWVKITLGGEGGEIYKLHKGEAVLIPAGVAHRRADSSSDFSIIGAYPHNQSPDLNKGNEEEYEANIEKIEKVQKPEKDPITGLDIPAIEEWK